MRISGLNDPLKNTEYRELDNGVFTNAAGTFVLTPWGNAYNGCSAVNSVPNSNCMPGHRWAYIGSRAKLDAGGDKVNIWAGTGVNSGTYDCTGMVSLCVSVFSRAWQNDWLFSPELGSGSG